MSRKSNEQGRASEFISLHSLQDAISSIRSLKIIINGSYSAAKSAWNTLSVAKNTLIAYY